MNTDTENSLTTEVALLKQAVGSMGSDVADIKADFKDFKRFYYTKEEAAYLRTELVTQHNNLALQFSSWKKFVAGVGVIVVAAIVLAVLKINIPTI